MSKGCYWTFKDIDGEKAFILVTSSKPKTKMPLVATYFEKKQIRYQYVVKVDSPEFEMVMKEFGLTDKDRIKETRSRKKAIND